MEDSFECSHLLDQCIELAAKNKPRDLHLGICFRDLPQSVFETKSLTNLYLDVVSLDEEIFGNIITSCPLIETLNITNCEKIRYFKVSNLHNLKRLIVGLNSYQIVEVEAPNLECVHCVKILKTMKQV